MVKSRVRPFCTLLNKWHDPSGSPSPAAYRSDCADTPSAADLVRSSWSWDELNLIFNYDGKLSSDLTAPVFPSTQWIERAPTRPSFQNVTALHRTVGGSRGRVSELDPENETVG